MPVFCQLTVVAMAIYIFMVFLTAYVMVKVQTACIMLFHLNDFLYTSTRNITDHYLR